MARFSVNGGDEIDAQDDGSGPSNRRQPRKKPKLTPTTTASASAPPPPPPPPPVFLPLEDDEDEEESEDAESYGEDEESDEEAAEEEESEHEQQQLEANEDESVDKLASYDRKLTLTLTDPDVLDCPLCYENLKIPVFQCENGHITCASCCVKIRNKCASCSFPTGYNRCRAIEKVLEASQVSCKNTIYGCTTIMKYYIKHEHERECFYSPCSCPALNCNFVDSKWNLNIHFRSKHSATNFHFTCPFSASLMKHQSYLFLREETLGTIFVLNQFTVRQGRAVSIVQAPKLSGTKYRYELKMKDGETSLTLKAPVECVTKLVDYRPTKHFLVVEDFLCPLERVTLDICISPEY